MAEEQKGAPAQQKPSLQRQQVEINIVRIAGKDLNGNLSVKRAITRVKGIGYNLAHSISDTVEKKFGIKATDIIGSLSEENVTKLEAVIKEPQKFGIPAYMLNRRRDPDTGAVMHLVGTDLIVMNKQDIDNAVKSGSWKGYRHQFGQKVNGQRTRSTGRTGASVGVTKKKVEAELKKSTGGGAAPAAEAKKPAAGAEAKK